MEKIKKQGVHCANCGVRTGILTRTKLSDKSCLCANCRNKLPELFFAQMSKLSSEEYSNLLAYINQEAPKLAEIFKATHSFSGFSLDIANRILLYQKKYTQPLYLKIDDISLFKLERRGKKFSIILNCNNPSFSIETIIAGKNFGSNTLDGFMEIFNSLINVTEAFSENTAAKYDEISNNTSTTATDIQKALALFMFDSLNDVTLESLKTQRNNLIKSFNPNTGTEEDNKYTQKINEAYMLLLDYAN